jgi:hypothetical protein
LDYLKEKESLQFEFHRKYEKSKYSSAAGLPTLTSFRKIRIGCKMISRKRLQKEKDRLRDGLKCLFGHWLLQLIYL